MTHSLPPLKALRAFEATARHLSIKLAAHELNVTPGAIGQQIKILEDTLGKQLFKRMHRAIQLTDAGREYLPAIRSAFREISAATQRLAPKARVETVVIGVEERFALKWLIPKLPAFLSTQPSIDYQVEIADGIEDLSSGRVDLLIHRMQSNETGIQSNEILVESWFPVCSPSLLSQSSTEDIFEENVLLHRHNTADWDYWLHSADRSGKRSGDIIFGSDTLLFSAALAGQGVALAYESEVQDHLQNGTLVEPTVDRLSSSISYYMSCPKGTYDCPEIIAFRTWLISEIEDLRMAS